jgi:hypothetical protein
VNGFTPPGRLRLLLMWLGDLVYGLLISLGWQPREQRKPTK